MDRPSCYQDNSALQWQWAIDSLKKFPFNENDKVLDVGRGNGKITAWIAKQLPKGSVSGIDCSSEMVAYSSSKPFLDHLPLALQEDFIEDIVSKQMFDSDLAFPDGSFSIRSIKIEVIAVS